MQWMVRRSSGRLAAIDRASTRSLTDQLVGAVLDSIAAGELGPARSFRRRAVWPRLAASTSSRPVAHTGASPSAAPSSRRSAVARSYGPAQPRAAVRARRGDASWQNYVLENERVSSAAWIHLRARRPQRRPRKRADRTLGQLPSRRDPPNRPARRGRAHRRSRAYGWPAASRTVRSPATRSFAASSHGSVEPAVSTMIQPRSSSRRARARRSPSHARCAPTGRQGRMRVTTYMGTIDA